MNIHLGGAAGASGFSKTQAALLGSVGIAGVVAAAVLVVPLIRGNTPKTANGQSVSADEARLQARSDEQRARSSAQANKLRQQDVGQGFQFDTAGNLLGAPTENAGDLPKNRHFDEGPVLRPLVGPLPPAGKAAYPANVAIARGIERDETFTEPSVSAPAARTRGGEPNEGDDRSAQVQSMLGYSTVAGATWAGRRPQAANEAASSGAAPPAAGTGETGPGRAETAVDRMVKVLEDSVRQGADGQPHGGDAAGASPAAGTGGVAGGGYWGAGSQAGPAAAGDALYPQERRAPAELKAQGMAPGAVGDMRIGGVVGPDQVVRQGKFLDCAIVNEIRADLVESPVIAMVARDFVSLDGKYVLVPSGSKLLGEAGRIQNLQQERVYIRFDRVIFPDQRSAYFPVRKVPAVDGMGAVGVQGDVDRHLVLQFGAAVMLGVLDGVGAAAQSPGAAGNPTIRDLMMARTSTNFSTVLAGVIGRYANVVPTVSVGAGSKLKAFFSEDVRMSPYMMAAALSWVGGSP